MSVTTDHSKAELLLCFSLFIDLMSVSMLSLHVPIMCANNIKFELLSDHHVGKSCSHVQPCVCSIFCSF